MVDERRAAYDVPTGEGPDDAHVPAASQFVNNNVVVEAIPFIRGNTARQNDLTQVVRLRRKQASRNIA